MLEKIPHISDRITSLLASGVPDLKLTRMIGAFDKLKTDERMLEEARINNDLLARSAAAMRWRTRRALDGSLKENRMHDGAAPAALRGYVVLLPLDQSMRREKSGRT
jgi:hypothetical protein